MVMCRFVLPRSRGFTMFDPTALRHRRLGSVVDVRSESEQLRAELKPGAPGYLEVEIEAHLAVLHEHLRDSPLLREVVDVADRQHRRTSYRRHDRRDLRRRDASHVQEMAGPQLAVELDLRHTDGAA